LLIALVVVTLATGLEMIVGHRHSSF
jgi:hypothetical protein